MNARPVTLFVSAGELSGEQHAAKLVTAVRALRPDWRFVGFGGDVLARAGVDVRFPLSNFAVMGFKAVFAQIGRFVDILKLFERTLAEVEPDAVVLTDYPGLHLRMASLAKAQHVPVVDFICPQLWAWAPWRARRFANVVDLGLTILPFEQDYFRGLGIEARFVGHPTAEQVAHERAAPPSALAREIAACELPIALLPGSRGQEIRTILPLQARVVAKLLLDFPRARFFLPQTKERAAGLCRAVLEQHPELPITVVDDMASVLRSVRFAVVASGTATFEVACHGVPMVVLYKITRWHRFLAGQLLTVPWISLVNLIAGAAIVPEFVVSDEPIDAIARACKERIEDGPVRTQALADLDRKLAHAREPGASDHAARALVEFVEARAGAARRTAAGA